MRAKKATGPRWLLSFKQDFSVFARLFPWRVAAVLSLGLAVTALFFEVVYNRLAPPTEHLTYVQAVLSLVKMLQLDYDLPVPIQLDPFLVLVPLLGLPLFFVFGVNVINVIRIFLVRGERGQAWQLALASTVKEHIVICGLGRVGYRVAVQLMEEGLPVVGINDVQSPLVDTLMQNGLPVIIGDVRDERVLGQAGVERARTAVVCTDQDLSNIKAAFHVRELNPGARIILRLFEDEITEAIGTHFEVDAIISRSMLAAIAFAHAAVGVEVVETFQLDDRMCVLARVPLDADSPLVGCTLAAVNDTQDVSVLFLRRGKRLQVEPDPATVLQADDELFVFARSEQLGALIQYGVVPADDAPDRARPILVSGVGHTGYRVVLRLLEMGLPVVALDAQTHTLAERLIERGVSVQFGDCRQHSFLERCGAAQARALVACSEDDMLNLEAVLRAREINPRIRTVLRLFEEGLGRQLQETFGIEAVYSASAIASPAFVAAVLQVHVAQLVEVDGTRLFLARLKIGAASALIGVAIGELNREEGLTVALHAHCGQINVPPMDEMALQQGDELVVLASQEQLSALTQRNGGEIVYE